MNAMRRPFPVNSWTDLAAVTAAAQQAGAIGTAHLFRMLLIECSTATADAWMRLVGTAPNRPRTLLIRPSSGVHPVPPDKGQLQ